MRSPRPRLFLSRGGLQGRASTSFHEGRQHRQHDKREQGCRCQTADHDRRQRLFATSAPGPKATAIGIKPSTAERQVVRTARRRLTAPSTAASSAPLGKPLLDRLHQHQGHSRDGADTSNEADRSRDREGHASRQQRQRAADQCERNACEDECGLRDRPEGQEQENADQQEDQRNDQSESGAGPFEILELSASPTSRPAVLPRRRPVPGLRRQSFPDRGLARWPDDDAPLHRSRG